MAKQNDLHVAGTKRIGYILSAEPALAWQQATAALEELKQLSERIDVCHRAELQKAGFAVEKSAVDADEIWKAATTVNKDGHLYKSATVKALRNGVAIYCEIVFTVCVKIAKLDAGDADKNLKSKYWYNVIFDDIDLSLDQNVKLLTEIEAVAKAVLDATLPIYNEAYGKVLKAAGQAANSVNVSKMLKIFEHCFEPKAADALFDQNMQEIALGTANQSEKNGTAFQLLRSLLEGDDFADLRHPNAENADSRFVVLQGRSLARGLYFESDKKADNGIEQRAFGVTSPTEPSKDLPENADYLKRLHHRPSNSISATRSTAAVAGY